MDDLTEKYLSLLFDSLMMFANIG